MLHAYDGSLRRVATAAVNFTHMWRRDLKFNALENVFPDEQERRVDNGNHQKCERDWVGRRFRQSEFSSSGGDGESRSETEKCENCENDLNEF